MRAALLAGILVITASLTALRASPPAADLKGLYNAHEWFGLRDAVAGVAASSFYRGAVAYAFNDSAAARKYLEEAIASAPGSAEATDAHGLLIYVDQREGHYRKALDEIEILLKTSPGTPGLKNAHAFFAALSQYPEQFIATRRRSAVRYSMKGGNLFVPVTVNGHAAQYIVDTGANFSAISESEAARIGLAARNTSATGTVVTGAQMGFRIAVAPSLTLGEVNLRDVLFFVFPDGHQPFVELAPGERGVLGIPVLLALETLRWKNDGEFDAAFPAQASDPGRANLCFEGVSPVAEAVFATTPTSVVLDTGATRSTLGPSFAKRFPAALRNATKSPYTVTGVGDSAVVDSLSVPEISLQLGGRRVALRPANVLLEQRAADDRWFSGRIGMDLLRQSPAVAVDFRAMRLRLQP